MPLCGRDVIGRREVSELPLKARQFLDLAMLSPGVVRPPGGTRGDAMQQAGNLVNVLGQRSGHNLYLMDGVSITEKHFNNMVIEPSISAIEEVSIEKTSYAPEVGGKSGAVINVISRSGSNDFIICRSISSARQFKKPDFKAQRAGHH
jgi:hypothetical protein